MLAKTLDNEHTRAAAQEAKHETWDPVDPPLLKGEERCTIPASTPGRMDNNKFEASAEHLEHSGPGMMLTKNYAPGRSTEKDKKVFL